MGAFTSRQNAGVEEVDVISNHAYKYPPRTGNYFGSHFIMGGERFDTPQPEAYLFGENGDLNFLGSRPTPFPYPPPQANEPTKTLKSLVNIRKESLRFVRCAEAIGKIIENGEGDGPNKSTQFNIEFTFDCDSRCAITIYYFCTEEFTPNGVVYNPRDSSMNSHTYRYKRGANQQFSQATHIFDPSKYTEDDLLFNSEKDVLPIAIHCVVEEGLDGSPPYAPYFHTYKDRVERSARSADSSEKDLSKLFEFPYNLYVRQSHTTIAVVEKHSDGTYVLKALKQKLFVDGLCYLLQEIYGIENKNVENNKNNGDEDCEDNGSECVICMCDVRDTLILPCRHLCLCNSCADSLRYQANNCPICRAPFRALLQIRALQKQSGQPQALPSSPPDGSSENIPAGYEAVSLIEALNGPCPVRVALPPPTPQANHAPLTTAANTTIDGETTIQAAEALNRCNLERQSSGSIVGSGKVKNIQGNAYKQSPKDLEGKSPRDRALSQGNTPEFRMSVLLAREEEEENNKIQNNKIAVNSPLLEGQKVKTEHMNIHEKNKNAMTEDYNTDDLDVEIDSQEGEVDCEGDSDAEKLSPLLTEANNESANRTIAVKNGPINLISNGQNTVSRLPLHLEAVLEPIDDTDTDEPEQLSSASVGGPLCTAENESGVPAEDSDYFTPEDTHTTILSSPHHQSNNKHDAPVNAMIISSTESTPQRWAKPHHVTSLPGTPLSHISNRSSGDSYSSSSSTKQLLANAATAPNNIATTNHQPSIVHNFNSEK